MFRTLLIVIISILFLACSKKAPEVTGSKTSTTAKKATSKNTKSVSTDVDDEEPPPPPPEGRTVIAFQDGKREKMYENQAVAKGLTIIDLSNYWVPFLFSERNSPEEERKVNAYRKIFRKLANDWPYDPPSIAAAKKFYQEERKHYIRGKIEELRAEGVSEEDIKVRLGLDDTSVDEKEGDKNDTDTEQSKSNEAPTPEHSGAGEADHYLEVYGIPPSLSVLKQRIEEVSRDCFKEVDYKRITAFDGFISYKSVQRAKKDSKRGRGFAKKMRKEMERLGVEEAVLLLDHPENKMSKQLIEIGIEWEALAEAQEQLVCEGFFPKGHEKRYYKGGLDWKTHDALVAFERKNRIFGWGYFGEDTIKALGKPREARLFDSFMRVLTERIVDATEIIEDGTAVNEKGEPATYKNEAGQEVPVPNLVAEFTALTAKNMGLTTPQKVMDFLTSFTDKELDTLYVAVPLPALPPYYSDEMEFHSVINRGDVWYEYPYTTDGKRKGQPRSNMPMNTLYVKWNEQNIPLVRMNTTIGSWRTELAPDGFEYFKYKNSDVGPRVWKDIVAGPVWMPPDSTPTGDLTKKVSYRKRLYEVPNYSEFGPGYASAYGLVAAFHYRQVQSKDGSYKYLDNGIRSHGSVDYNSILRRYSHGCHRLYNHLAIRLFNFVIHHKTFNRVGQVPVGYSKKITTEEGEEFTIKLDSRGYKYELIHPIPVMVQKGRIRGKQKTVVEHFMPKPGEVYGPEAQFIPEEYAHLLEPVDTDTSTDTDTSSQVIKTASSSSTDTAQKLH